MAWKVGKVRMYVLPRRAGLRFAAMRQANGAG
jgi:hypothetical protein